MISLHLILVLALLAVAPNFIPAVAADPVHEPNLVRRAFDRLNRELPEAARQGFPPVWVAMIEDARWEALADTRRRWDRLGDYHQWGLPFQHIHAWSLKYAIEEHRDARLAVIDAVETLQMLRDEETATQAVMAVAHILDVYLQRWRQSHAPEAIRLLDRIETWALAPETRTRDRLTVTIATNGRSFEKHVKNTRAAAVWAAGLYRHQAYFLENEHLFDPADRAWLRESRETWLQRVASDNTLPLDIRTPAVTAWARALYNTGQTDRAERCLLAWQKRHGEAIRDAGFYAMMMAVPLFGRGDWERADAIRAAVNRRAERFDRHQDRRAHQRMHAAFYDRIALPDYELRRLRAIKLADYRDRIAAADTERREQAAIKEAHP